ncbi:DUF881 domain-containing protein [Uniformispora flossi]|uniref:DUF881 domain-containing protein n=1 Tax=Uniformispora flossi TaxID=3390723 RepID=UPI003C2CB6E0
MPLRPRRSGHGGEPGHAAGRGARGGVSRLFRAEGMSGTTSELPEPVGTPGEPGDPSAAPGPDRGSDAKRSADDRGRPHDERGADHADAGHDGAPGDGNGPQGPRGPRGPGGDGPDGPDGPQGPDDPDDPDTSDFPEHPHTDEPTGRRRLLGAVWPPRVSRAQLIVGLLLFALGAGLAIQVRSNTESDPLRGARESDLVRILDELEQRTQRLDSEKHRLEVARDQLESSNNRAEEARQQTEQRAQVLGILAGTVKATGPGITLTINDPLGNVRPDMLLDTLQELRAAGAEAIQINQVRVVASTWFDEPTQGQIVVDGQRVTAPYTFKVIGNPQDLQPALNIPGGVIRTLEKKQAQAVVTPSQQVVVDALRVPTAPDYARTAPGDGKG